MHTAKDSFAPPSSPKHGIVAFVAVFILSLFTSAAAADSQSPLITPGFSDNQTFETLRDLFVTVTDNEDASPDLPSILLAGEGVETPESLNAIFPLACPSGYTEMDGQCLQELNEPPVWACPDGFTKSGTECTKRVVVQESPSKSCPLGYIADTGSDPTDALKECVKYETAPATLTCSDYSQPLTLIGGTCYVIMDPEFEPSDADALNHKPRHMNPEMSGLNSFWQLDSFLSPVDNTYYLPPSTLDRDGYDAPHGNTYYGFGTQWLIPRNSDSQCPAQVTVKAGSPDVTLPTVDTAKVGLSDTLGDGCMLVKFVSPKAPTCKYDSYVYNEAEGLCLFEPKYSQGRPIKKCPEPDLATGSVYGAIHTLYVDGYNGARRSHSTYTGVHNPPADKCWRLADTDAEVKCPEGSTFDSGSDQCVTTDTSAQVESCEPGFNLENGVCSNTTITQKVRSNTAQIDLPVLAPGQYSLAMTAEDESGNTASKNLSFTYRPRGFNLDNGSTTLRMPAVALALSRLDGTPALVTDVLTDGGQVLTGSHPVYATLVGDSEIPLMVEGTLVEQGKTVEVVGSFDMDATGGRLELNVAPYYEGVQGDSSLMLTVGESGSLVSVFDVKTWTFQPSMTITPTDPIALFGQMDIRATGAGCTPVATREKAMQYDVFDAPACYIRWNQVPAGLSSESGIPSLTGVLDNAGEQTAGFEAVLVEPNGFETVIGSYSETFSALDFYGSIGFKMTGNEKPVLAGVDEQSYSVSQSEGPSCLPAATEEEALSLIGGQSLVCFIEWVNPPSSMDPIKVQGAPALRGAVPEIGENVLTWRVNLFDSGGQKVVVNEQSATVIGEEPETPNVVITADSTYETESGSVLNLASPNSSYDAFVAVTGADAPMSVQMLVDGVEVYNEVHESRFGDTNRVTVPLALPDANLWDSQNLEVRVAYETMPGYTSDVSAEFLTVPSAGIEPELDSRYLEAVNTGSSPLTIKMTGRNGDPYDMATMGQWQARLVKEVGFQRYEPVTDFVTLTGAETTSNLNFNEMMEPGEVARIMVEAQLISPIPEYQRTAMSRYPTSIALLDGSAIEGSVQATRMSGSAPVRGIFTLALDDRDTRDAIESVVWEVSSDGGATWVVQEEGVRGQQLRRSFDTGDYLVRTKTVNKHTGVEFITEPLIVTAYTRPDIEIDAPSTAFIGATVSLTGELRDDNGNLLDPEDFFLEWSTDNGETYEAGGPSISLQSNERTDVRVILRARDKRAPEDDYRAYAQSRAPLAFRDVRPPRVYIRGTRAAEVGEQITLTARVSSPYLRMAEEVKGYWVLPDGSTSTAPELTMTAPRLPEGEDYLYVDYVAWVDGYREQGAEITRSHRMRFWEYRFPEFRIEARQTADVAPVEISAYVRPLGYTGTLDDPQYEWVIPDGVEVTWDRSGRARVMKIEQAGTYTLQAKVTDARGNESITTRTFDIGVPEPLSVDMEVRGRTALRAPYEILVRPIITGGHPRDYYEDYVYEVDGEILEDTSRYGRVTLPEGEHTVKLSVTTRMGERSSGSVTLNVPPNTPPTCELTHWESYGSWRLNADCSDVDGRVMEYLWEFDGEPAAISSSRISVPSSIFNGKPEIDASLKALDDSAEFSPEVKVRLQNLNP